MEIRSLHQQILSPSPPVLLFCSAASVSTPATAHISGSFFCSVSRLKSLKSLSRQMENMQDRQVVCYQTQGLDLAAHVWWLLKVIGVTHAEVLDGGLAGWTVAGYPVDMSPMPEMEWTNCVSDPDDLIYDKCKYKVGEEIKALMLTRPVQLLDTDGVCQEAIKCPAALFMTPDLTLVDPESVELLLDGLNVKRGPAFYTVVMGTTAPIVLLALNTLGAPNLCLGIPREGEFLAVKDNDKVLYHSFVSTVFLDAKGGSQSVTSHEAQPVKIKKKNGLSGQTAACCACNLL